MPTILVISLLVLELSHFAHSSSRSSSGSGKLYVAKKVNKRELPIWCKYGVTGLAYRGPDHAPADNAELCGVPCDATFTYRGTSISGCIWNGDVFADYRNFACIPASSNEFKPCTLSVDALNVKHGSGRDTIHLTCKSEHIIRVFNSGNLLKGKMSASLFISFSATIDLPSAQLIDIANECDGKRECDAPVGSKASIVNYMCSPIVRGPIEMENCVYKHCVFPFNFHGTEYTSCISVTNSGVQKPFCSATPDYDRDQLYCFCDEELMKLVSMTRVTQTCAGPCRSTAGSKRRWCPTTRHYDDDMLWMWCE